MSASRPLPPAGFTLIEALVTIGIIVVAFGALIGLFQASLRYVYSARAQQTAASLATEEMESIRAMNYDAIGTVGGIVSCYSQDTVVPCTIPQNQMIVQDGVTFNRNVDVNYYDDPADGIGSQDLNEDPADYKKVRVEVSWNGQNGASSDVTQVSNFIPVGVEKGVGQGTLAISVIDSQGNPVPGASVHITNSQVSPPIDTTIIANTAGQVLEPGTPKAASFHIVVTKSGYSTAQTYPISADNPSPNPGDLTVSEGELTSAAFAIDQLATLDVSALSPAQPATTTDTFSDSSGIAERTDAVVSGGALALDTDPAGDYYLSGSAYSVAIAPPHLSLWRDLAWSDLLAPDTSLTLHLYTGTPGAYALVPDSALPGNAAGFTASPIDISGLSTSTYPSLTVGADLATLGSSETPSILDWSIGYGEGPTPIPGIDLTLQGSKTIGDNGGGLIYKNVDSITTDSSGTYASTSMEFDSYTLTPAAASGYDFLASCPAQTSPGFSVPAGKATSVDAFFLPNTDNALSVVVINAATGAFVPGATVTLARAGYRETQTTDACAGAYFGGLTAASDYSLTVSATGYTTQNETGVGVSGATDVSVSL